MKKKIIVLSLCTLLLAGCSKKSIELKDGEQVITSLKNGRTISVKELYEELKKSNGLETLISMIDKIILEDKYSNDLDAAKEDAESTIKQLKDAYGDELEQAIQYYTSYKSIEDYQNFLYVNYLQQKAIDNSAKTQISESDIKKYYKDEIKPDIKVSHILITVDVDANASEEDQTNAENAAKSKAEEVISKLKDANNVSERFKELANEYSSDDSTKEDGGNLGYVNVDTLGDSYTSLIEAAYKLKDGEYSKEVIKTELGYHVILRTETKEKASLEEVRDTIIDKLVTKYNSEHTESTIKAMQELRKEYDMNINDEDLHQKYVNYIQNSLSQLKEQANNQK